jgi:GMP synthase-like glutamine amidotransferase
VLGIVHEDHAGPGVFGEAIRKRGDTLEEWMVPTVVEPPGDPLGYDAVLVLGGAVNVEEGDEHPWLHFERGLIGEMPRARCRWSASASAARWSRQPGLR